MCHKSRLMGKKKELWESANIMNNYFHKKVYAACVDVTRAKKPTKSSAFLSLATSKRRNQPFSPLRPSLSPTMFSQTTFSRLVKAPMSVYQAVATLACTECMHSCQIRFILT